MQRRRITAFLILMALGLLPLAAVHAQEARKPANELIQSTVLLIALDCDVDEAPDGDPMGIPILSTCQALWNGSGTILSPDGVILTNAHVALDTYPDPSSKPVWLAVGLTTSARELPSIGFLARAEIFDVGVDLAVVTPKYTLDGKRIKKGDLELPPLHMEEANPLDIEVPVRIFGYPGSGRQTITIVQTDVSGFVPDDDVPEMGNVGLVKTNDAAGPGVSGGTMVDDTGNLVGVPTEANLNNLRCADADADGFVDAATECGAIGGEQGFSRPMPEGFNILIDRARAAGQLDGQGEPAETPEVEGTPPAEETPTPEETPEPEETPDIPVIPENGEGVIITGTIVEADTGDPISGAFMLVFKPGITVEEAIENQDPEDVLASAESNRRGTFQLNNPVERGEEYSILVVAEGYEAIGGDDVQLARDDDPNTVDLGTIELAAAE